MKTRNVMKFFTFLAKNTDAPYYVKHTVWDSAIVSSIFYSSETWLTSNLKAAESVYISTVKQLLGVRVTTLKEIALFSKLSTLTLDNNACKNLGDTDNCVFTKVPGHFTALKLRIALQINV